jgi:hypothetical protein
MEPRKFIGATRKNLQEMLKKIVGARINQSEQKFSQKKTIFSTVKVLRSQKFVWGYPTKFASSTQNVKKIIGTPNIPIRTKIFPKKTMFSTLKV